MPIAGVPPVVVLNGVRGGRWVLSLVALGVIATQAGAAEIEFSSIAVGTALADQFVPRGVRFVAFNGVTGLIANSTGGRIARFDQCACEFYDSGTRIVFSDLHQQVQVHLGAQAGSAATAMLLTAFDINGKQLAAVTTKVTPSTLFGFELEVVAPSKSIASVTLVAVTSNNSSPVLLHDVSFEDATPSAPDFAFEAPVAFELFAGQAPMDLPIIIRRYGGSTGAIALSVSGEPAGLATLVLPNPTLAAAASMRVFADPTAVEAVSTLSLTGTPSATAGAAPRSASIFASIKPRIHVSGSSFADLATCRNTGGQNGIVRQSFLVTRHPLFKTSVDVVVKGVPAGVGFSVAPSRLDFPGNGLSQLFDVELTIPKGIDFPNSTVTLELLGPGVDEQFAFMISGRCLGAADFVLTGSYSCINEGFSFPIVGASVYIYKYIGTFLDPWKVAELSTDINGRFHAVSE